MPCIEKIACRALNFNIKCTARDLLYDVSEVVTDVIYAAEAVTDVIYAAEAVTDVICRRSCE